MESRAEKEDTKNLETVISETEKMIDEQLQSIDSSCLGLQSLKLCVPQDFCELVFEK